MISNLIALIGQKVFVNITAKVIAEIIMKFFKAFLIILLSAVFVTAVLHALGVIDVIAYLESIVPVLVNESIDNVNNIIEEVKTK